jgi:hypothetical protein
MKHLISLCLLFSLCALNQAQAQSCTAQIGGIGSAACRYQTATVVAMNQVPGATYNWTIPPGVTLLQNNGPSVVLYFPNQGNYTIALQQLCPSTMSSSNTSQMVYVSFGSAPTNPNMSLSGPDTVQAGIATNFNFYWNYIPLGPTNNSGYTLRYTSATSNTVAQSNPISPSSPSLHTDVLPITFPATYSTGKYGIAVVPWNFCGDTVYKSVHVVGALTGPAANCVGDIVSYTLNSGTANVWSVVGGTILSGQNTNTIQVQWNTLGTDSVSCNWTYGSMGTQTTKRAITVGNNVGTPTILGNPSLCNATQTYSVTSTPGHSYRWTVNGVNKSFTNSVNVVADNQPAYTITVYDSIGTCMTTASLTVLNPVFPHPVISGNANQCQNLPVALSVTSIPGATYTWNANGGTILSGAGTNAVNVLYPNSVYVTPLLTVNVAGCTRTVFNLPLTIFPSITPNLGANTVTCPGVPLTINNSNYVFNMSTSYSSNTVGGGASITPPGPGTYWLTCSVNSGPITCSIADTVLVAPAAAVGTDLGPDIALCTSTTTIISPSFSGSSGPYTYLWSTGATTSSITVSAGVYSVTVSAVGYCTDADTIEVLNPAMPPVAPIATSPTICPGTSTIIDAGPGYMGYQWSTGATTQSITVSSPGQYDLTATDATACQSYASVVITQYPTPPSILGNDTIICPDTFTVLNCAPFMSYVWSNGAITQTLSNALPGTYTIIVMDVYGCAWQDSLVVGLNGDCIWPGDANHDGVADNTDILEIGLAMTATGAPRVNSVVSWYGQVCNNWALNFPSLLNYKHADSDGDGTVTFPDTLIVIQNYGLTHNKGNGTNAGPLLQLIPLQPTYVVGDTVAMGVYLGETANPATAINGLAYSVTLTGIATNPGDVWISFPPSFLGTNGLDALEVGFEDVAQGQHDVAQSRIGASPVNGHGLVAILNVRTDSTMLPNSHNILNFNLTNPSLVDVALQPMPVTALPATLDVRSATALGNNVAQVVTVQVYPLPADQWLHIRVEGHEDDLELRLFDLSGQLCRSLQINQGDSNVPVADLSAGTYLMQVLKADHVVDRRKVTVLHRQN